MSQTVPDVVIAIQEALLAGITFTEIGSRLGMSRQRVIGIAWRHRLSAKCRHCRKPAPVELLVHSVCPDCRALRRPNGRYPKLRTMRKCRVCDIPVEGASSYCQAHYHGRAASYNEGCRCDLCQEANAHRHSQERARRKAVVPYDQIPHGRGGYGNYGCRCEICKLAWRQWNREQADARRAKMQSGEMPEEIHGTPSGYTAWFCRCDRCLVAYRNAVRRRRAETVPVDSRF